MDTYSALKPLTCNIRICLTIVLFPDSPAPESQKKRHGGRVSIMFPQGLIASKRLHSGSSSSPSTAGRDLNRRAVSPQHFPAEFLRVWQKQHWTSKTRVRLAFSFQLAIRCYYETTRQTFSATLARWVFQQLRQKYTMSTPQPGIYDAKCALQSGGA